MRYLRPKSEMSVFTKLLAASFFLLAVQSCAEQREPLPQACGLVSKEFMEQVLTEPVRNPTPANAGMGEISACSYDLPGRSKSDYLGIYVMEPAGGKSRETLIQEAERWKGRNTDADYEVLESEQYPMAWYPGEAYRYPSTFIILFEETTLAITGISKGNAQSIAFRAMQLHDWH